MCADGCNMRNTQLSAMGGYYWANYAGYKVLAMRRNGYINATKLCKDSGKQIGNWLKTKKAKELIETVSREVAKDIIITIANGDARVRGRYVHHRLAANIVSWISKDSLVDNFAKLSIKDGQYKKIKRTPSRTQSKKYTLNGIIKKVKPVCVLRDLTVSRREIKQQLRSSIPKYCGIYMFFNKVTDEYYIGSSKNIISRTMSYLTESYVTREPKYKSLIREAMIKYTKASFVLLILELIDDHNTVFEREKYYIHLLDPKYNVDLYSKPKKPSKWKSIIINIFRRRM
jgi:hypothetical protein